MKNSTQKSRQKTTKVVNKPAKLQLSVSSVETFQSCPAKWYYRYIEKLPSPKNYYSTAGSFIHKILEVLILKFKYTNNLRKAGSIAFKTACTDPELQQYITPEIKEEGKNWLKFIVKRFETNPNLVPPAIAVESPFSFKIEEPTLHITVRGFIDRIDQLDDKTIKIVDYKTSKDPNSLNQFQLATYKIALKNKYPNSTIKTSYELIRHEFQTKEVEISSEAEEEARKIFIKNAQEILELKSSKPNEPWDAKTSKLCDYCPYKVRCETDRLKKSPWKI